MANPLLNVPGLGGFLAGQQQQQAAEAQELQQAAALQGLLQKLRAQQQEQAYQQAVSGLGPNPTQDQLVQIASRHAGPGEVMKLHQASIDRNAATEQRREAATGRDQLMFEFKTAQLAQESRIAELGHQVKLAQAKTTEERNAEIARHNKVAEDFQRQLLELQRQKAQGVNLPAPKQGFRYKADGSGEQEPIPGGPVALKQQGDKAKAKGAVDAVVLNIDGLDAALADLDADEGLSRITGPVFGRLPNATNTATGAQAKLNTIKSQTFIAALQAMRAASPTGGAVGQVTEKEGDKLENSLAGLDQAQGTDDFRRQVKIMRDRLKASRATILRAYNEQFSGVGPDTAPPTSEQPGGSGGQWTPEKERRYQELLRRRGGAQ